MNIVSSCLNLTIAPISIKKFNHIKSDSNYIKMLDVASLYIICKREKIIKTVKEVNNLNVVFELKKLHQNSFIDLVFYLKDTSVNPDDVCEWLKKFTLDELLFMISRGVLNVSVVGDRTPFITYDVLYVGQCVKEQLTKRFKAHHALTNMLIEEDVISSKGKIADELFLLPFFCNSDTISLLNGESSIEDFQKVFSNDFSFGSKEVYLDCEKALVHAMNPSYNKIKFKHYPKSEDGLYNTEADAYCYTICEDIILKYKNGCIYGDVDSILTSKIIGDKDGYVNVYEPGQDYCSKYINQIL